MDLSFFLSSDPFIFASVQVLFGSGVTVRLNFCYFITGFCAGEAISYFGLFFSLGFYCCLLVMFLLEYRFPVGCVQGVYRGVFRCTIRWGCGLL